MIDQLTLNEKIAVLIFVGVTAAIVMSYVVIRSIMNPKYRIIETNIGGTVWFTPQIKLNGVWLDIYENRVHILGGGTFIVIEDAIASIEKFKKSGTKTIPSNAKLEYNQKVITIE
jgi:hypothetical protein